MISKVTKYIQTAAQDRMLLTLCCASLALIVIYSLYLGLSLHPSDVQVAVRYTAFGATTYYREQWYYLISFIIFVVAGGLFNIALGIRLNNLGLKNLARGWLLTSIVLILITFIITHSVIGIAYL